MRRTPLVALFIVALSACTSTADTIDTSIDAPSETSNPAETSITVEVADEESTVSTVVVEETTTTTSTTVPPAPEPETRCITVLKCQFAYLQGVDYSLLKLEFTDFSVADLKNAKFVRANLKETLFIRADLTNVDFTGADLSGANLTGAIVTGANFTNAKMKDTVICSLDLETVTGIASAQLSEVKTFRAKGARYCP